MLLKDASISEDFLPQLTLSELLSPLPAPCLNQKITEMQIEQSNLSVTENISELIELH
jgi:hypothetical protein